MNDSQEEVLKEMTQSEKYRAFRNFMTNELGIGREEIKQWVIESVRSEVSKLVGQLNTEEIARYQVQYMVRQAGERWGIEKHFREEIGRILNDSYSIRIVPKPVKEEL